MPTAPRQSSLSALALLACAVLLGAPPAWAGCGCDHPPPAWSLVMPPFGSPGKTLTLTADGLVFELGAAYVVDFGGHATVTVQATQTDRVEVDLPKAVPPGPVEMHLSGPGIDLVYPDSLFTALPKVRRIKEKAGLFSAKRYDAAIGSDGTLYLALDVSQVLDPMQFTFALHGLALHFSAEDVVIYNADGVDLSLFTLAVTDATVRQWGSYYGWRVESDHGLMNDYYLPQTDDAADLVQVSSIFTYWRHEFYTYAAAHAPGGSHEVDANALHPDGTVHVDHDRLIIAIRGVERDALDPLDLTKATPLTPGSREVAVGWLSLFAPQPIEMPTLAPVVEDDLAVWLEELEEILEGS